MNGEQMIIYCDGKQTRDFVDVRDVVEATILASEKEAAIGEIINVGSGIATDINKLSDLVYLYFSNN
jgi:nucleoside-diphosphate-sugar epimerase